MTFVGWLLSLSIIAAIVYGLVPYLDPVAVPEISRAIEASYGSLHRWAWTLAVGWIIIACTHGHGGVMHFIHYNEHLVSIMY